MSETPPNRPPDVQTQKTAPSLVIVNTGDGKGKSSSAFGVVTVSYTHLTLPTKA